MFLECADGVGVWDRWFAAHGTQMTVSGFAAPEMYAGGGR